MEIELRVTVGGRKAAMKVAVDDEVRDREFEEALYYVADEVLAAIKREGLDG